MQNNFLKNLASFPKTDFYILLTNSEIYNKIIKEIGIENIPYNIELKISNKLKNEETYLINKKEWKYAE